MTKWCKVTGLLALFLIMTVSCRQLYTTSFGKTFARDGLTISGKTSIGDLLDLANGSEGTDPDAAKEILDVLAGKTAADIVALSVDDKTTILDLAATAAIDMAAITALATSPGGATIEAALAAFDTSVDLTAITTLLANNATITSTDVPITSIVFASAVVLADLADSIGANNVTILMDGGAVPGLTVEQQGQADLILNVVSKLETRPDAGEATIGKINLLTLLQGTAP